MTVIVLTSPCNFLLQKHNAYLSFYNIFTKDLENKFFYTLKILFLQDNGKEFFIFFWCPILTINYQLKKKQIYKKDKRQKYNE